VRVAGWGVGVLRVAGLAGVMAAVRVAGWGVGVLRVAGLAGVMAAVPVAGLVLDTRLVAVVRLAAGLLLGVATVSS
jgi:hypothetical protein